MLKFLNILNYFHLGKYQFAETVKDLFGFFYIRLYLIIIIGINLLNWLFVFIININVSQNLVVLHYNIDFGVNLIGDAKQIYIIPFMGLIIILINLFLMVMAYKQANQPVNREGGGDAEIDPVKIISGKLFANLLLSGSLAVNFFLLIGISSIYLINFFR